VCLSFSCDPNSSAMRSRCCSAWENNFCDPILLAADYAAGLYFKPHRTSSVA
jgi:hypothetical protein